VSTQLSDLEEELQMLSDLGERYRQKYSARRLSTTEVVESRKLIVEIRNVALRLQKLWDAFADTNIKVETILEIFKSKKLTENDISQFSINLTRVSTIGVRILRSLDNPFRYMSHYKRQCNSLKGEDAILKQEDATELQSTIEQLIEYLKNDIESKHWQIQLVSLYSQTKLTSSIRSLTRLLVILTGIVIIGTIIAAVTGILSLPGR
jgi:hypothetical protein